VDALELGLQSAKGRGGGDMERLELLVRDFQEQLKQSRSSLKEEKEVS